MVAVFREVRRVLRDDGTVWLNLGDSYSRGMRTTVPSQAGDAASHNNSDKYGFASPSAMIRDHPTIKPKDLIGIPWRVAFALQTDGWYLRSDIVWAKGVSFCPDYSGSVMPESVTDRPTKSHEYLFLLTKSARYYYDADAVRENFADERQGAAGGQNWTRSETLTASTGRPQDAPMTNGRNLRSVWTINPQPYREAHFATYPTTLVEPCVKAGSKTGDTVLDPFAGSGTTGLVAGQLGRGFIGIELSTDYYKLADERINGPLFAASGRPSSGQDVQGESQDRTTPLPLDDGRPESATGDHRA